LISLDNGRTFHAPANLDPAELDRLWNALVELADPIACWAAHADPRMIEGNKVLFLELYFEHNFGSRLTVG